jgi:hypothetical protein
VIPVSVQPVGSEATAVRTEPELVEYTCRVPDVAPLLPVTVNWRWVYTGPVALTTSVLAAPKFVDAEAPVT